VARASGTGAAGGGLDLDLRGEESVTVGLVADTHGHLDPRVLEALRECTLCVHAGDVGAGSLLRPLAQAAGRLVAVRGNNDVGTKWPPAELDLLAKLPTSADIHLPGGVLSVVHGDAHLPAGRRHARLRLCFPHARAIAYGHSHRLVIDAGALPWVLNPGAAGRSRTHGGPSCIILRASVDDWSAVALRFPASSRDASACLASPPRTGR
jgi:hypothetical protein